MNPSRLDTLRFTVLVLIVLVVGLMAGAASFSHVHDWTIENSPEGTQDWFGWANAVISELIPTAALIVIAQRRRTGGSIGYPMFLLVLAVGISLTAQLAVARPTVFGWMVSALPALAFFGLSKLVFTTTKPPAADPAPDTTSPAPATTSAPMSAPTYTAVPALDSTTVDRRPANHLVPSLVDTVPTGPAPTPAPVPTVVQTMAVPPTPVELATRITRRTTDPAPAADPATPAGKPRPRPAPPTTPAPQLAPSATDNPVTEPDAAQLTLPIVDPALLERARDVAVQYHATHGTPITAGQLAVRLKVTTSVASQILAIAGQDDPTGTTPTVNGRPIKATR